MITKRSLLGATFFTKVALQSICQLDHFHHFSQMPFSGGTSLLKLGILHSSAPPLPLLIQQLPVALHCFPALYKQQFYLISEDGVARVLVYELAPGYLIKVVVRVLGGDEGGEVEGDYGG